MTLDEYLRQPGVTAAEFAQKVDLTEASISRIRKGGQNIRRDVIRRIVSATGGAVTADELIFDHAAIDTAPTPTVSPDNGSETIGEAA